MSIVPWTPFFATLAALVWSLGRSISREVKIMRLSRNRARCRERLRWITPSNN